MTKRWVWMVPMVAVVAGCGSAPPAALKPKDPTPLAKCSVAKSQASPLVTEWPASEKANLESMIGSQAVVVSYSGCEMRVLGRCRVQGSYGFRRTTLAEDTLEIKNADELYAKVPLGAAGLEAELESSGRLAIRTTVVGQLRLEEDVVVPDTPACEGATHVITAVSIGAFELLSGGAIAAGGGITVGNAGVGARHRSEESQLRSAGSPKACRNTDTEPHVDCSSPLQVFLSPAERGEDVAAVAPKPAPVTETGDGEEPTETVHIETPDPVPAVEAPPPAPTGPKKPWDEPAREASVEVHFQPPAADIDPGRWMVLSPEGDVLCKLPCVRRVGNDSGIRIQLDADRKEDIKVIPLPDDLGYSAGRKVRAVPELGGPSLVVPGLTLGVGAAALGGGIAMIAVSDKEGDACGDDGLCSAGLYLAVGGAIVALVGGSWLWGAASNPRHGTIDVTLIEGDTARLDLAPQGLVGRF